MKKLLFTAAILGLTAASFAQVPNYVPTNGLVGWWPFNGNANDESGNSNNGTVNGATLTTDRFGNANKAYSFDGVDDYISATPSLPIGSEPRSVSSWFKTVTSEIPTSQYPNIQCVTGWGNPFVGEVIFPQFILAPTGRGYFESGSGGNQLFSQNSVNDGQWHNITTTYNGPGSRVKLYIDGLLQDSSAFVNLATANSFFGIGNVAWANVPYKGEIDEVGVWNRALSDCEIQQLYNASIPNSAQTQTALDSYTWPVNGQTYTQSGNYIDTLTNAVGCDSIVTLNLTMSYTSIEELSPSIDKKLIKITDLNGKEVPFRKNVVLLFIYDDGTVERVFEVD